MASAPLAPLALTMGDPAGCGPQITAKAWRAFVSEGQNPFVCISDPSIFDGLCPIESIDDIDTAASVFPTALPVLPLSNALPSKPIPGMPTADFAPAILESIETTAKLALTGKAAGVVTNPIAKSVLYSAGFSHPGHTEFIAEICRGETGVPGRPVMMLTGGGLKVALATIHQPLKNVPDALSIEGLVEIGATVAAAMRNDFGISAPRLAFCGLNPHAGEDGTIGDEEVRIINPAATALRAQGISIPNARPADTVFHEALSGDYDAVIAMTHDQGLIPVKTLDFWGGVNTTLGLTIVRTSPDHGTAYDAAAKGNCRADSLIAALKLAGEMARHRKQAL
ncbi:MAG: 4-hydroxythreonine-4-phosphate dehydrogenase PdxA [Henriciella sp.]